MFYSLYKYDTSIDLLYINKTVTSCYNLDNRPMNEKVIKLHKGVDNVVRFKVFDSDKKLVSVDDLRVQATFIDLDTRERVLRKECDILNKKGILELTIYEDDLVNMAPSYYTLSITGQNYDVPEQDLPVASTPFYTDAASNIELTVEVLDGADKTPVPTVEIAPTDWIRQLVGNQPETEFICGPFPANRLKNYQSGTHTLALYCENYTGTFEAFGTLELVPPTDINLYFPLNLTHLLQVIEYTEFTGIDPFSFNANIMWIMFRYKPDPELAEEEQGAITKLQLRS